MTPKAVKAYLLSKPEAAEDYPFGPDAAVFKIKGKMFALQSRYQGRDIINLKCDPNEALMLRDLFEDIIPGYHMNKKHWNTVYTNGSVPKKEIERMIDHSYALVVHSLKKAERKSLELEFGEKVLYSL